MYVARFTLRVSVLLGALAGLSATASSGQEAAVAPGKFIPVFAVKYGSTEGWPAAEEAARFDLIDASAGVPYARVYASEQGNSWQTLKRLNPHLLVTHDTFLAAEQQPLVAQLDLPSHRGVILLKPEKKAGNADNESVAGEASNLVSNGGFEIAQDGDEAPLGWTFDWKSTHSGDAERNPDKQKPDFAVDAVERHGGKQSVRIGVARPQDDGALSIGSIAIDPAVKVYRASAWIKTRDLRGTDARLAVVFLGPRQEWLGADYSLVVAEENHDWRRYVVLFKPVKEARTVRLRLWVNFEYSGTGTAWFDDVELEATDLADVPPLVYADPSPMPPASDANRQHRGYVPFVKSTLETVYPQSVPRREELADRLEMTAFPGEREAAAFCLRALEVIPSLRLEPADLKSADGKIIAAGHVRAEPVECLMRVGQSRWGDWADEPMLVPVYVEETSQTSIAADSTRQIWVTVAVPEATPPGNYSGAIRLTTARSSWDLPLQVKVYPFALPEPDRIAFGMYSFLHPDDAFMDAILADMRAHGMTTLGLCCNLGAEMTIVDGQTKVHFSDSTDLVRALRAYQKAGFRQPILWLMGGDVLRFALDQGPLESDAFAHAYRGVLLAILEHSKAAGWPEIIFQPVDEPFEHTDGLPAARRCLEIMKTIPGLRTEEDGPNGNPSTLEELYDLCDVLAYHDGPWVDRKRYDAAAWNQFLERTKADGKTVWFYNIDLTGYHPEAMRFGYGVGLWAARGQGMIEWAYGFPRKPGTEESAYTNPSTMFFRYPRTAAREPAGQASAGKRREGVKDYKLLALFAETAAEAAQSGDPRRQAAAERCRAAVESELSRIRFEGLKAVAGKGEWTGTEGYDDSGARTVSGRFKMDNGWTFADYDRFRTLLADAIAELNKLTNSPD